MKVKAFSRVITVLFLILTIAGCAGGANPAGTLNLDAAFHKYY
jgi:PBP1b-binding outer membrane lipoprotein LpoB